MKTILFTNARNEPKLKEWATHHLLIGFDLIIIFDHKSDTPINNLFENFDSRVKIIRCELELPIKLKLMMMATSLAKKYQADWMLYLDADEFLILNAFIGVKHMLNYFKHADSIAINWLMFGTNNLIQEPEGLLLENYTKSDLILHEHVKSFVRPNKIMNATNPHFFVIENPKKMYNMFNKVMIGPLYCFNNCNIQYSKAPMYIAHYIFQSEETYTKRKRILPRDDTGSFRATDINHSLYNNVLNESPKQKYAERVKQFLEEKNEKL